MVAGRRVTRALVVNYRLRIWLAVLALLCIAPAGVAFLLIDLQQSSALLATQHALDAARATLREELRATRAAQLLTRRRVADALGVPLASSPTRATEMPPAVTAPKTSLFHLWRAPAAFIFLVIAWVALVGLLVEFRLSRRLKLLEQVVRSHAGPGSASVRRRYQVLIPLAVEVDRMASSVAARARRLESTVAEQAKLLHEIHHRVKNNFAIIASLLRLHRRSLPPELQPDIRFLEEHIQATALAYKVAYSADNTTAVPIIKLTREVILAIAEIAEQPASGIRIVYPREETFLPLDKAISLSLCIAYRLPFYVGPQAPPLDVELATSGQRLLLIFRGLRPAEILGPPLRERLSQAYFRQLDLETKEQDTPAGRDLTIEVPLG